jgi:hypothetical protein
MKNMPPLKDSDAIFSHWPDSAISFSMAVFISGLTVALQRALIGASRRDLSSTFDTHEVEHQKIERFLLG